MASSASQSGFGLLTLWYCQSAERWLECLPVGNGRLGAMVWGGVYNDRLSLSESTCWSGEPSSQNINPDGLKILSKIRRGLFKNEFTEATCRAEELIGRKLNYGTNLPVGNLNLRFLHRSERIADYRRYLDLDTAVAGVTYIEGQAVYSREVFVSNPDQVIVVRLSCDRPGNITFDVSLDGGENPFETCSEGIDTLLFDGRAYEKRHSDGKTGVSFHGRLLVIPADGAISVSRNQISVKDADSVTLLIALDTTLDGNDPVEFCKKQIEDAALKSYEYLRDAHIADHQRLFRRVEINLGSSSRSDLPIDRRLEEVRRGQTDSQLTALLFQYGRYLLIASSRENSPLPAHLQGVWNDSLACSIGWTCDYHLDINTQMNYWPAEVTNLSECHEPLFCWIENRLVPSGQRTAKVAYGCGGWVAHTVSNAWGYTAPGWSTYWGFHPTAGVWIASHLWEHYQFCGDKEFLRNRAYPVLKESAKFFVEYMVRDPRSGWLLTGPACSPENAFLFDGKQFTLSMGPTCDRVLIHDLFSNCIEASRILDIDAEFRTMLEEARSCLPPLMIGKHGQLQEWLEDYDEALPNHRHICHLISLFPSDQITLQDEPELARAARTTINRRLSAEDWEATGWSMSNLIAYFARLQDGDAAMECVLSMLQSLTADNMFVFHPPLAGATENVYELDGNTGVTSGMAEMLLQSHRETIALLPALPKAWPNGYIRGLQARGGFEVDIEWNSSKLSRAVIKSKLGGSIRIRSTTNVIVKSNGERVETFSSAKFVIEFETAPGKTYELEAVESLSPRICPG